MYITNYKDVLIAPTKQFSHSQLFLTLRKIYHRVHRRPLAERDWNYERAPHLQKMVDDLGRVAPHVVDATLELLDTKNNQFARIDRQQFIPVIWALGNMGKAKAAVALAPFVRDRSDQIRLTAIEALGSIGELGAINDLLYQLSHGKCQNPFYYHGYSSGVVQLDENEEALIRRAIINIAEKKLGGGLSCKHWLIGDKGNEEIMRALDRAGILKYEPTGHYHSPFTRASAFAANNLLSEFDRPMLLDSRNAAAFFGFLIRHGSLRFKEFIYNAKTQKLAIQERVHNTNWLMDFASRELSVASSNKEDFILGGMSFQAKGRGVEVRIKDGDDTVPCKIDKVAPVRDHLVRALDGSGAVISQLVSLKGSGWFYDGYSFMINLP